MAGFVQFPPQSLWNNTVFDHCLTMIHFFLHVQEGFPETEASLARGQSWRCVACTLSLLPPHTLPSIARQSWH
jgi:hypothetical protein